MSSTRLVPFSAPSHSLRTLFLVKRGTWLLRLAAILCAALACLASCSGPEVVDRLGGVDEDEATQVIEYTSRQMQIGYQIASTAAQDNALDLCFEMCGRSVESCRLSGKVCDIAAKYEGNAPLAARCDVTRERCRVHRTKVPRQCSCDPTRDIGK